MCTYITCFLACFIRDAEVYTLDIVLAAGEVQSDVDLDKNLLLSPLGNDIICSYNMNLIVQNIFSEIKKYIYRIKAR